METYQEVPLSGNEGLYNQVYARTRLKDSFEGREQNNLSSCSTAQCCKQTSAELVRLNRM